MKGHFQCVKEETQQQISHKWPQLNGGEGQVGGRSEGVGGRGEEEGVELKGRSEGEE